MNSLFKNKAFYAITCLLLCSCGAQSQVYSYPNAAPKVYIPSQSEITAMEDKLTDMVNQFRQQKGLVLLNRWSPLRDCARKHSQNMADGSVNFGHDGFDLRFKEMGNVVKLSKFAENVAYTYLKKDPLQTSLDGWINSPGHYKNMVGDYRETGIGIAYSKEGRCYLTQLFAKKMKQDKR